MCNVINVLMQEEDYPTKAIKASEEIQVQFSTMTAKLNDKNWFYNRYKKVIIPPVSTHIFNGVMSYFSINGCCDAGGGGDR